MGIEDKNPASITCKVMSFDLYVIKILIHKDEDVYWDTSDKFSALHPNVKEISEDFKVRPIVCIKPLLVLLLCLK